MGADWATVPRGTVVKIDGVGQRRVQDKPANWIVQRYNGYILDVYFDSHTAALNFGRRERDVWAVR